MCTCRTNTGCCSVVRMEKSIDSCPVMMSDTGLLTGFRNPVRSTPVARGHQQHPAPVEGDARCGVLGLSCRTSFAGGEEKRYFAQTPRRSREREPCRGAALRERRDPQGSGGVVPMHRVAAAIGLESMLFSLFPGDYMRAVAGSNPATGVWPRAVERPSFVADSRAD